MADDPRLRALNDMPERPGAAYVLYWMQQSGRTRFNHALEHAVAEANRLGLPPLVCFGLTDDYPEANARHYLFLLQGLRDVGKNLHARGIGFVVRRGSPERAAVHYARDAALVVCDRGYLRHQKQWRDAVARAAGCRVVQVETDVVVPVERVSDKHESVARTIRPKIRRQWDAFLTPVRPTPVACPSAGLRVAGDVAVDDPDATLKTLKVDRGVPPVPQFFTGGEDAAAAMIRRFVGHKLDGYAEGRNEPAGDLHSYMAMYLHFGQVSPVELGLTVRERQAPAADKDAYLEELIVRRELSMNFCHFEPRYDQYACLPEWAKKTLADHAAYVRPTVYTLEQLEHARTADAYWNAAQKQMTTTGFMHNYMRMYWGKKILEWTESPQEAFERTLYLNNKYFLCGRDANSYTNVAWVFGLHDRPWGPKRKIFGTVRYMNAAGLKRKYDIDRYVRQIDALAGPPAAAAGS